MLIGFLLGLAAGLAAGMLMVWNLDRKHRQALAIMKETVKELERGLVWLSQRDR